MLHPDRISSIAYLIAKLVNVGVFPPSIPTSPAQPSFFRSTLPAIRTHLGTADGQRYSAFWIELLSALPSSMALRSILTSLCSSLTPPQDGLDASSTARALVKREALLLKELLGPLSKSNGELSETVAAVSLGRTWSEGHARIFACWAAGAQQGSRTREGVSHMCIGHLMSHVPLQV